MFLTMLIFMPRTSAILNSLTSSLFFIYITRDMASLPITSLISSPRISSFIFMLTIATNQLIKLIHSISLHKDNKESLYSNSDNGFREIIMPFFKKKQVQKEELHFPEFPDIQ